MVEGSRHPCCKDDVPDRRGSGRDTDVRRHGGLDGGRQCSDRGRCCVPRYQSCRFAGTGETVKRQKKKEPDASGSFKVLSEDDHRNS